MGKAAKQGFLNSVIAYIGVGLGAVNTMFLFPRLYEGNIGFMGLVTLLLAYSSIFSSFGHLGIPHAVIKYFPIFDSRQKAQYFSFGLLISAIASMLLIISSFVIPFSINNTWIYFSATAVSMLFFEVFASLSHIDKQTVVPLFLKNVGRRLILLFTLLIYWVYKIEDNTFLMIFSFGYVLHTLGMLYYSRHLIPSFNIKSHFFQFRKQWYFGVIIMLTSSLELLLSRIDFLMIGFYLGKSDVAIYSIAFFVGSIVSIPSKSITTSLRPYISEAWANENLQKLRSIYGKGAEIQLLVNSLIFFFIVINLGLVNQLLPDSLGLTQNVIVFIGLSQIVLGGTGPSAMILLNSKYFNLNFKLGFLMLFLLVGFNIIMIPKLGIEGAALGSLISVVIYEVVKVFFLYKKFEMHPFSKKYIIYLIFSVTLIGMAIFAKPLDYSVFEIPVILNLFGISVSLYFAYSWKKRGINLN